MAGSILKKLLGAGLKKKQATRKGKPDTKKQKKANEDAARDTEILTMERLLNRTKDPKTRKSLQDKLMVLKHQARKGKKPPEKAKKEPKQREKPMAKDLDLPNFLKKQAGPDVSDKVKAKQKKKGKDYVPEFLKKQAE